MEAAAARSPGFGDGAARSGCRRSMPDRPPAEHRLILAACLLHDVNWRAHPDYRAELCFESVTRANIAGIDHAERVFLGLALLNRYKARGAGRGGRAATAGCCRRSGRRRRRCSAGRCGSGRCCRARRSGVLEHSTIAREDGALRADADADRRASSPARRSSGGCRRWRRGSTAPREIVLRA